jgi:hypothetical protein
MKFGLRPRLGASSDGIDSCLKITCVETGMTYTVPVTDKFITEEEPGMAAIYFDGTNFVNPRTFDSEHSESESEE